MKKLLICTLTFVLVVFVNTISTANPVKGKKLRFHSAVNSSEDSLARKNNFPLKDELPYKKIKWVDDEGGVDCISYKIVSDKPKYKTGEAVKLKIQLDYIDQLPAIWKQQNCTKLSVKLVFPENFIQTGGTYYDFIPLIFSDKEKSKELTIEGKFISTKTNNPCFLLLKGPQFSNTETIFIKKLTKCFSVVDDTNAVLNLEKRKVISQEAKYTNFGSLSDAKKNQIIQEQLSLANTNNPIRLYTSNPEFCSPTENCDSVNICSGETVLLYAKGCENGTIQWSTGDTTKQIVVAPILNTSYSADCMVNQIPESSDIAKVTVSTDLAPNYTLTISGPDSVCANESLYLVPNGCPTNASYSFKIKTPYGTSEETIASTESLLLVPGFTFDGNYDVSFKCIEDGICGSSESPIKTVKIIQPLVIDSIYVPLLHTKISSLSLLSTLGDKYCIGETTTFIAEGCRGTIRWSDNSLGTNLMVTFQNVSQNINYTCEYNGCERIGSFTIPAGVTKLNTPTLVFDYDTYQNVKAAQKTLAATLTLKAGQCDREYMWWDGTQTQSNQRIIDVTSNTTTEIYSVKCADPSGECISDSASVGLYILSISATNDSLCFGESAELSMTGCTNGIVRWFKENETSFFGGGNPYEFINESIQNGQIRYFGKCVTNYINQNISTNHSFDSEFQTIYLLQKPSTPTIVANKLYFTINETVTLTASNCNGQVEWSNGMQGSNISFPFPGSISIYSNCKVNNCISNNSNLLEIKNCASIKPIITGIQPSVEACASLTLNTEPIIGSDYIYYYFLNSDKTFQTSTVRASGSPLIYKFVQPAYIVATATMGNCASSRSDTMFVNALNAPTTPILSIDKDRFCDIGIANLSASNCINGTYLWKNNSNYIGGQTSNSYTTPLLAAPNNYTNATIQDYYAVCRKEYGCEMTSQRKRVVLYKTPPAPQLTPTEVKACIGETIRLVSSRVSNQNYVTRWSNITNYSPDFQDIVVSSPQAIYTVEVNSGSLFTTQECISPSSNIVLIEPNTPQPKITLTSSITQFCGNEEITIKSTNCNGTLNWQWTNTNGQSGTLTADSIKTSLIFPTSYTAKCTNSCGTSAQWSDPITISKYVIDAPTIFTSQQFVYTGTEAYLFASNCDGGTVTWSNGMVGDQIQVLVDSIGTYTATCKIGTCLSGPSNQLEIRNCNYYKPTIQLVSESVVCAGGNKSVVLKVLNSVNQSVEWKVEDEQGNVIYSFGRPSYFFADGQNTFDIPENSYISARVNNCSQWSEKLFIQSNGTPRPNLTLTNHPYSTTGLDLFTEVCSSGEDSLMLKASNGTNGEYVWLVSGNGLYDSNNQFGFTGNMSFIYMDGGNYGFWTPTVAGQNDSLFTYKLQALDYGPQDQSVFVFNYKDGCLSYPTQLNLKQRLRPIKPVITSQESEICPGNSTLLSVQNPQRGHIWYNQSGIQVSSADSLSWVSAYNYVSPLVTTNYYAIGINEISGCQSEPSDAIEVKVTQIPDSVEIVASRLIACENDEILLKVPSCQGLVVWQQLGQSGILGYDSVSVSPTVATSYIAQCQVCNNYINSDTITIQIGSPTPPVISVSNQLVCNSATGRVPIEFTATGCPGGTIVWSDGTVGSTFTKLVNESIIYSAICQFGSCASENSNLVQITVLDPPLPPILSASTPIKCEGDSSSVEILAEACNGSLTWFGLPDTTTTITVTPLVTTTYTATCTNECGATSESLTIIVEQKPSTPVFITASTTACIFETVNIEVNNCQGTVFWINELEETNSIERYLEETTTFKAICISSSGTCISDTATLVIEIVQPAFPVIEISKPEVCLGDTIQLSVTGCTSDIRWFNDAFPESYPTIGTANPLSLVVDSTLYLGIECKVPTCLNSKLEFVTIYPSNKVDSFNIYTSSDSICLGSSIDLEVFDCYANLVWSNGETANVINVTPTITTTYTATCYNSCDTTTASITIVVNQAGAGPNLTAFPSNICQGEEVRFTVSGCSGNLVWLNEDVQQDLDGYYAAPSVNTTYAAICDNNGCLSDTSDINIAVNAPLIPYLTIASDSSVCLGGNVLLEVNNCSGLISWSNGGSSIADSTGKGSLVVQVNAINTFSAICKPLGCSILDTTNTVTVNYLEAPIKPTVNYSSTQICKGEGFTAIATGCNGTTFWSNGFQGDTLTLSPSNSNVYYAYCSNSCGISLASDFTLIEVINPALIAITSSDSIICTGDSATLTVNGCNGIVSWNTPEGNILDSTIIVAPLLTATYQAVCVSNGCSSNIASYTLTVRRNSLKPTISTNTGETAVCGGSSISLTASGCLTGTLVWSDGQTNVNPITVTPTRNRGGYSVQCLDVCSNTVSDSIYIEVKRPIAPELSNDTLKLCYGENFTLNVTSACDLGLIAWNDELLFGETLNLTADFVGRKVYRARCFLGNCQSPLGKAATVIVAEKPTPSLVATSPVKEGEKLNITVSGNGKRLDVVEWSGPAGFNPATDLVNKNVRIDPATLAHSGQYTIVATNGGVCTDSAKIDITVLDNNCGCTDCDALTTVNPTVIPEKDYGKLNYITETSYLKEYQTIPAIGEGMQKVSYFDGMGRATQQVGINAGGTAFNDQRKVDVVSFMEYDEFGRETKKYLPFAKTSNGGSILSGNLWNQQKDYYATQPEKAADQNFAFAETLLEESPLNRVLKQSSPGQDTQLSTNHITSVVYGTNNNDAVNQPNGNKSLVAALLLNKVKQFDLVGHEAQIESQKLSYKLYTPNQLNAVVNINEDEQYSAQFTDKEGKVVTTRQYNRVETAANVFEDEVLETNYVYDLFGRLRFVIQPEATKVITGLALNSEITPFTATYKDFVFYYQYDKRGRMTRKRVPGLSEFVTMEYDERDLLIKSTDANGKITSTDYDALKRPIRNYLQNNPNETPVLLTESFYDKYEGLNTAFPLHFDYVHASNTLQSIFDPIDLPTGTKTLVLNENNQARLVGGQPQYLTSIIYYDYKKRPLQTVSENIFGKVERTSNKLDFSGRILESHSTTEYLEAGVPKTLDTYAKNTYDQASRLAAVCQKLDNDKWEPISRNSYSPIGELTMKKLGCDQQRVDFDYNIKGWLTNINKPNTTSSTFLVQKDLFAMKLNYAGNFTGNIMGQQWQTADRTDKNAVASTIQNYNYQYDELNRILKADFVGSNINGITTTMYNPTQTNKRAYDLNGNILGLYRNVNNQPVDVLTYNYTTGNRLNTVTDASTNTDTRYFTDLNKSGADYTYDAMGNMITDANKRLTGIAYNHQNLPTQIERTGDAQAGKMKYYYTGTGQKLMVEIFDGTATTANTSKTRYYLGGLVMKGSKVEFINTPEGRAIPKTAVWTNPNGTLVSPPGATSTWTYEYHLKDHLGNLRVACRCGDPKRNTNNGNIQANATREPAKAVQTEDYDAWGLSFGSNIAPPPGAGGLNHRYLYNGKEQVQDLNLGLYEYGFRWYDAQIAKFVQVDPLAEKMPSWNSFAYAFNNPINFIDPDGREPLGPGPRLFTNTNNARSVISNGFNAAKYGKYSNYNWFSTTANAGGTGRVGTGTTLGIDNIDVSNSTNISNKQMKEFYNAAKSELGYTSEQLRADPKLRAEVDGLKFSKLGKYMNETGASSYKVGDSYAVSDAVANKGVINSIEGSAGAVKALNGLKVAGKTLMVVGIAADTYEIFSSGYNPRVISGVAGGWAGAYAGAELGAAIGTGIGVWIGGVGEVVTAPVGGLIGGAIGYFGGKSAATTIYDKVTTKGVPVGGR